MSAKPNRRQEIAELRRYAEERLRKMQTSEDNAMCLLHELHVHQIELEMQNEELRNAQNEKALPYCLKNK